MSVEGSVCFFPFFFKLWKIAKFQPGKYDFDLNKHEKKNPQIFQISKNFVFEIVRFYDKLQYVAKNIERFYLFFYFHN